MIIGASLYINKHDSILDKKNKVVNVDSSETKIEPTNTVATEDRDYIGSKVVNEELLLNAPNHLDIPTYVESDNQAIHPSIYHDVTRKFGYEYICLLYTSDAADDSPPV